MKKETAATRSNGKTVEKPGKKAPSRSKKEMKIVEKVIARIEQKLQAEEIKATLADFIRLLQLRKELEEEEEQPKEIEVTWVDPSEKEHVSET